MSCINNSTISGIFVTDAITTATSGKRLSFKQNTSIAWDSSILAGDVIRYDVDDRQFVRAIADPNYDENGLSNAEVVGIVESISQTSGVTYATVVTSGLMNYPNLLDTISGISASSGGTGGTDIFFLSPTVLGGITFEISEGNGYIAKPVLQVCPTSDGGFNSVVVNYLGYETAQSADYTVGTTESTIGEFRVIKSNSSIPDGWINAQTAPYLSVDEYPESYALFSATYGSKETLVVNSSSILVTGLLGKKIRPIFSVTNSGIGTYSEIVEVDPISNSIVIEHLQGDNAYLWENGQFAQYEIQGESTKLAISSGETSYFKLPTFYSNITISATDSSSADVNTLLIMRVKPDSRVSYLPDTATFKSIQVTGTVGTVNYTNIDAEITSLKARVAALEAKLG